MSFVVAKVCLSQQTFCVFICHDKPFVCLFVMTNLLCVYLSWQTFCVFICHDKPFVTTKMLLAAAPASALSAAVNACGQRFASFVVCWNVHQLAQSRQCVWKCTVSFCSCVLWNVLWPSALLFVGFVKCTVSFCSFVHVSCEMYYVLSHCCSFMCFVKCTMSFPTVVHSCVLWNVLCPFPLLFIHVFCEMKYFLSHCCSLMCCVKCTMSFPTVVH